MINFQAKLKEIFKRHNLDPSLQEPDKLPMNQHKWHIYKRSLPINLNKPVILNLTEKEADKWLKRLPAKRVKYDYVRDIHIIHYYDKIRSDKYLAGVYDNPNNLVKGD